MSKAKKKKKAKQSGARAAARAEQRAQNKAQNEELLEKAINETPQALAAEPEKPKGKKKLWKRLGIVAFVALNAAVIYFTAVKEFSGNKSEPLKPFTFQNVLFLLGGLLCLVVVLACESIKYMMMMRHLGEKVSLRHAFVTAALGKYYDCITPSGAGGQPFQIYYLHTSGYSNGAASAMPLTGFLTMQFGFVFLCIITFIFGNGAINATGKAGIKVTAYIGAIAYTIVPVMILISGIAPKISMRIVAGVVRFGAKLHIFKNPNHMIVKAIRSLHNYSVNIKRITQDKALFVKLLVLSTFFQLAMCSMPFFAVHAFGGDINYFDAVFICVFVMAAITLVPTPGNSGAAEGLFYIAFSSLDKSGTFWAMLVWRLMCYYSFIIIGVLIYGFQAVERLLKKRREATITEKAE